ncbi:uncharacterized protein [Physcomitrium patens]|uniref:uncharacterized protein n=1 Tax=Physcomitrium patens TaxID=3218 RepID=UPI003CCE020D
MSLLPPNSSLANSAKNLEPPSEPSSPGKCVTMFLTAFRSAAPQQRAGPRSRFPSGDHPCASQDSLTQPKTRLPSLLRRSNGIVVLGRILNLGHPLVRQVIRKDPYRRASFLVRGSRLARTD